MSTVRLVFGVAAAREWHVHQMDVHNAFLHGDLAEEVYMKLPQGFLSNDSTKVCRLRKSLYGLKQAPRCWFAKLSTALESYGFKKSLSDYLLFTYNNNGIVVHVLVYVDDLVSLEVNSRLLPNSKSTFRLAFMKDLGILKHFLGTEVARNDQGFYLSQRNYVLYILSEIGLLESKPSYFPMEQNHKLSLSKSTLLQNPGKYHRLIGKLNCLAVTKPELSYSVHTLAQFMQQPRQYHWEAALRVVRYLKFSHGHGILLARISDLQLNGWCDSDCASFPLTRRSLTGYFVQLGDTPISWKTRKQDTVSLSSAEAEYRPMRVYSDSKSAIALTANPIKYERTKHVEIDCHFIRNAITSGNIPTTLVSTHDQLADIFTKALSRKEFHIFLRKLDILDAHAPA